MPGTHEYATNDRPSDARISAWPIPWFAIGATAAFWIFTGFWGYSDMSGLARFMSRVIAIFLFLILIGAWWLTRRKVSGRDRLLGLGAFIGFAVITQILRHRSMDPFSFSLIALPAVLTSSTIWLLISRRFAIGLRRAGLVSVLAVAWLAFGLIRAEGLSGEQRFDLHWRWSPTPEARYLAQRSTIAQSTNAATASMQPILVGPTDWPQFRGPNRDGVATDASIRTDWDAHHPAEIWRHRIGPGWSSVIAVDDHLFTQEQRGDAETVVCFSALTGDEIWSHVDPVRFEESQGGVGPRATPTYSDGKLFALGATGILNCLDAPSGRKLWSRDLKIDGAAQTPMWGFASSPLIAGDLVVVYAGGGKGKGLLAYKTNTGELMWTTPFGTDSYSSPQLSSVGGVEQISMLSDAGVVSVSPKDGAILWTFAGKDPSPRSVQPHRVDDTHMLIANGLDLGVTLVGIDHPDSGWKTQSQWTSRGLKPSFNDFVIVNDAAFGLDANIFSCIDLKTGQRKWKGGRYGYGQVILLAVQQVLLVNTDDGEIVLIAADASAHRELGRFKAIQGKTWNHIAIARGKLFVRNGEEIAAFDLSGISIK